MKKIAYDLQGIVPARYIYWAYKNGLTDTEASRRLGMSHGAMHHWKHRGVKPTADTVVRMMKVMKVKEEWYV